jgi:hypothetical protein
MQNVVRSVTRAIRAIIFSSAAIALAACGTDTADARSRSTMQRPTAPPQLAERRVAVTRVRVILQDGRPHAYVEGELGDGCTSLSRISQRREANTLAMTFTTFRHGEVCAARNQLLNAWVALDGPFTPGEHILRANDVTARFHLVAAPAAICGSIRIRDHRPPFPNRRLTPRPSGRMLNDHAASDRRSRCVSITTLAQS